MLAVVADNMLDMGMILLDGRVVAVEEATAILELEQEEALEVMGMVTQMLENLVAVIQTTLLSEQAALVITIIQHRVLLLQPSLM